VFFFNSDVIMQLLCGFLTSWIIVGCVIAADDNIDVDEKARAFLRRYNAEAPDYMHEYITKAWAYFTNLTDYNSQQMVRVYIFT